MEHASRNVNYLLIQSLIKSSKNCKNTLIKTLALRPPLGIIGGQGGLAQNTHTLPQRKVSRYLGTPKIHRRQGTKVMYNVLRHQNSCWKNRGTMRTVSDSKALYALYSPYGVRCTLYTSYAQGVQNPKSHEIHAFHNYFECKLFLFESGERAIQIDWASACRIIMLGSRLVEHVSGDVVKNANFEFLNWR